MSRTCPAMQEKKRVLIGSDPERKLADDSRVRAIRRKEVLQGTKVNSLIEIRCLVDVEVLLQISRWQNLWGDPRRVFRRVLDFGSSCFGSSVR